MDPLAFVNGEYMRSGLWLLIMLAYPSAGMAQSNRHLAAANRVSVHRIGALPWTEIAQGVRMKAVMGSAGTFSLIELDGGATAPPEQVTGEQGNFGVDGRIDFVVGDERLSLEPGIGIVVPPDATHSLTNADRTVSSMLQFHTVRPPDLMAPRSSTAAPARPATKERAAITDLGRFVTAPSRVELRSLVGEASTLTFRRLSAQAESQTDIRPRSTGAEQFAYVLRGEAELVASRLRRRIGAGDLIVIPASAANVLLRPLGNGVVLVEFHLTPRARFQP
jgi:glyoxylate utilization-related uncharacterized protein